jgi:hypothetical protein
VDTVVGDGVGVAVGVRVAVAVGAWVGVAVGTAVDRSRMTTPNTEKPGVSAVRTITRLSARATVVSRTWSPSPS